VSENTVTDHSSSDGSLGTSLRIQLRVIGALLMREVLTRYGRHNIGFLWLFAEPMIFTLGVAALWTAFQASHGSSLPIVAFAVTGYSSVLLWRNMPQRCINAVEPNAALMYHRNVKILDILISRLLLEAMGATMSFVILSAFFIAVGSIKAPEDPLKIVVAWFSLAWFGGALALTIGAASELSDVVEKLFAPITYFAFPLSGAAFLVDAFPSNVQGILLLIPMVNGTEMLRDGYFGSSIRTHYDISYLWLCSLVLTLWGLAQVRIVARRVTVE
jgi:ABC-type polysaccharide/polyol phosphate export permease